MTCKKVLRRKIGSMPMDAEMALACALSARRLRHAARCNCGAGKQSATCTTTRGTLSGLERHSVSSLLSGANRARDRANAYRANRTWTYGGERHVFDHTPTS